VSSGARALRYASIVKIRRAVHSLPSRRGRALVLALLAALLPLSCGGEEAPRERPDVVFILIDTLRADHLGAFGYDRPTSPRLDRLAEEGARFTDVTAQSSWTLPSMVSLFSGRYLTDYRDFPANDAPQIAETFRAAGYATVGVVGNVLMQPERGYSRGFDHYDARPGVQPEGVEGTRARDFPELEADLWGPVDAALNAPERKPLFLYLHPFDPHGPYKGDPRLNAELPLAGAPDFTDDDWHANAIAERGAPPPDGRTWAPEMAQLKRDRGLYDQDIRLTDEGVARVLDGLAERGVLDNAIVVIASDHGECLWERVSFAKPDELKQRPPRTFFYQDHGAFLYQEGIHTPLILWGAGVPAGVTVDAPVENVDVFPTLLELCNVPARGELHGRSLAPLMRGERPDDWRDEVYSHILYGSMIREVTSGEKFIVTSELGQKVDWPTETFRLKDDPLERNPLDDEALTARLRARIHAWRERYPTESTFGRKRDEHEQKLMGDLGYTEQHTGGDE